MDLDRVKKWEEFFGLMKNNEIEFQGWNRINFWMFCERNFQSVEKIDSNFLKRNFPTIGLHLFHGQIKCKLQDWVGLSFADRLTHKLMMIHEDTPFTQSRFPVSKIRKTRFSGEPVKEFDLKSVNNLDTETEYWLVKIAELVDEMDCEVAKDLANNSEVLMTTDNNFDQVLEAAKLAGGLIKNKVQFQNDYPGNLYAIFPERFGDKFNNGIGLYVKSFDNIDDMKIYTCSDLDNKIVVGWKYSQLERNMYRYIPYGLQLIDAETEQGNEYVLIDRKIKFLWRDKADCYGVIEIKN